jgi:hypothetical protein
VKAQFVSSLKYNIAVAMAPQAKILTIFIDSSMKNMKIAKIFACGASEKISFL